MTSSGNEQIDRILLRIARTYDDRPYAFRLTYDGNGYWMLHSNDPQICLDGQTLNEIESEVEKLYSLSPASKRDSKAKK